MSEQKEQDWKEARINQYTLAEGAKQEIQNNMTELPEIIELERGIAYKQDQLRHIKQPYLDKILECDQLRTGIKLELADKWDVEEKTFECNAGSATLRTTRSLIIRNKQKLIEFLALNKKLSEFIKSFEITKLRKIKDAGLLESEIATWDEKRSISISIKGAKKT